MLQIKLKTFSYCFVQNFTFNTYARVLLTNYTVQCTVIEFKFAIYYTLHPCLRFTTLGSVYS